MTVSDHRRRTPLGIGIAAAVIGLHHQIGRKSTCPDPGFLHCRRKFLIVFQVLFGQHELMCTGTPLRHDGNSLEPDHRALSFGLPHIPAQRQLRGRTVRQSVRPFHRGDSHAVLQGDIPKAPLLP